MKRAAIVIGTLIALGLVGYGVHWRTQLEPRLLLAIEEEGSAMTGCRVEVVSLALGLLAGRGRIEGLTIANPEGFSDADVFRLGEIEIKLDLKSLVRGPTVIEHVFIRDVEVFFEMDERRRSNVQEIADHLLLYDSRVRPAEVVRVAEEPDWPAPRRVHASGDAEDAEDASASEDWQPMKIRDFVFDDARLVADVRAFGGFEGEYDLPGLRLSDLGGEEGRSAPLIGLHVMTRYAGTVLKTVASKQIDRLFEGDSKKGIKERARDFMRGLFN